MDGMSWTGPRISIENIYSVSRYGWDELDWSEDEYQGSPGEGRSIQCIGGGQH